MKYLPIFALFLLISCGSETGETTGNVSGTPETEQIPEDVIANMQLNAEESSATWERFLDQKATKKKVKLFGAMVDMELGPMKLNMNGDVTPIRGDLTTTNGIFTSGNLIFDMATFKFAEEQGQGLFDTKDYPESELTFDSFKEYVGDNYNYMASMTLTIQEHSEKIEAPMSITTADGTTQLTGVFSFNTLDFPLRDNAKKSEVNVDKITVNLDLKYVE